MQITTKIAGVFQYPEAKQPMKALAAGGKYAFEREPTNAYDKNAIAIFATTPIGRQKCGYVPRDIAAKLAGKAVMSIVKGDGWDQVIVTYEESQL